MQIIFSLNCLEAKVNVFQFKKFDILVLRSLWSTSTGLSFKNFDKRAHHTKITNGSLTLDYEEWENIISLIRRARNECMVSAISLAY